MNTRGNRQFIDIIINGAIVFISYLLAVVIRYYILDSQPGIDALSAPYLLIALVYSILIACTFDQDEFPRWLTSRKNINSTFQLLTKNAIGCLLLLSAFYITGIVHFSRWALILFWIISTLGLLLKREILYSLVARKRSKGADPWNVLIVGDGELAKEYIRSVTENAQFGVKIVGYLGSDKSLATDVDAIFDVDSYPEPIIKWLGEVGDFKDYVSGIDEAIIADDGIDSAKEILIEAHKTGIKTSLLMPCAELIRDEAVIRDLGKTKSVALNEAGEQKPLYPTGMVIASSPLFLLMIVRRFEMGAINTMKGFESYRCVLFALFAFFLFLSLGHVFNTGKKGILKRGVVSLGLCTAFIVIYELIYGTAVVASIQIDLVLTVIVLATCVAVGIIGEFLSEDTFVFLN